MALLYQRGTILCISQVLDPNKANPKDRYVLLLVDATKSASTSLWKLFANAGGRGTAPWTTFSRRHAFAE